MGSKENKVDDLSDQFEESCRITEYEESLKSICGKDLGHVATEQLQTIVKMLELNKDAWIPMPPQHKSYHMEQLIMLNGIKWHQKTIGKASHVDHILGLESEVLHSKTWKAQPRICFKHVGRTQEQIVSEIPTLSSGTWLGLQPQASSADVICLLCKGLLLEIQAKMYKSSTFGSKSIQREINKSVAGKLKDYQSVFAIVSTKYAKNINSLFNGQIALKFVPGEYYLDDKGQLYFRKNATLTWTGLNGPDTKGRDEVNFTWKVDRGMTLLLLSPDWLKTFITPEAFDLLLS